VRERLDDFRSSDEGATGRSWFGARRPRRPGKLSEQHGQESGEAEPSVTDPLGVQSSSLDLRSSGFAAFLSALAIAIAFLLGLFLGPERHDEGFAPATMLSVALVVSRYLALRFGLGAWIVVADALTSLVIVGLTSAPHSEFHFVALSGVWWAGRLVSNRGAAIWALAYLIPYVAIVVPDAWQRGALAETTEDLLTIGVLAVLVDWFMTVDRRVIHLSRMLHDGIAQGDSPLKLRRRLAVAAGESPLPIDTLVVAGRLGLRADEIELLGYILLGFGNVQIAEAIGRSEATVRYRLTGLYRSLGVRGRREAIERARELGLDGIVSKAEDRAQRP
jgi:DNA-binding CsgD family transcriptional regulator